MTQPTKTEAQKRVDRIRFFQDELNVLDEEKVLHLSQEQRQSTNDYHNRLLSGFEVQRYEKLLQE